MVRPDCLDAALAHLAQPGAIAVAGATWVLRAPLRHEPAAPLWVVLDGIAALHHIAFGADRVRIGALATHEQLAQRLPDAPDLRALAQAAAAAANPGVRRIATLGGNLCASDFASADLVPALLALDATAEVATPAGPERIPLAAFLERRAAAGPFLLAGVSVERSTRLSAHARLPMRKAGDYPAAIVSLSAALDAEGRIADLRVAVGAVEACARRWAELEARAQGQPPDPAAMAGLAQELAGAFTPRDGLDAPGWYRLRVLPALVRRAFEQLGKDIGA